MKITISNIEGIRASVEALVNQSFANGSNMIDVEHMQKFNEARSVLAGNDPTTEFADAAAIEGMTVAELATAISAKSAQIMARGNQRREWVKRVRAAQSVAELDAIRAQFFVDNTRRLV